MISRVYKALFKALWFQGAPCTLKEVGEREREREMSDIALQRKDNLSWHYLFCIPSCEAALAVVHILTLILLLYFIRFLQGMIYLSALPLGSFESSLAMEPGLTVPVSASS